MKRLSLRPKLSSSNNFFFFRIQIHTWNFVQKIREIDVLNLVFKFYIKKNYNLRNIKQSKTEKKNNFRADLRVGKKLPCYLTRSQ